MKRLILILVCSFVSAAVLVAQAPSPATTPQTTSTTTAQAGASKTSPPAQWITTASGLKYQDVVVGKGPVPKPGDDILVNYTGRLLTARFLTVPFRPAELPLNSTWAVVK